VVGVTREPVARTPSRAGVGLSAGAALVAVAGLAAAGVGSAAAAGAVGAALVVLTAALGERRGVDLGALVLFGAVLLAGTGGARAGPLLAAMVATVVAWDAGDTAVSLGEQLGAEARTRRAALTRTGVSALVGAGGAAVGYGVFRLAGGGRPASALVVLLLGSVLITWALRR